MMRNRFKTSGDSDDKKERGLKSLISFAFRMFITVTVSFAMLATVGYFVIRQVVVVGERPVPNVVGLTPEQALKEITQNKFTMTFEKYEYSTILEAGRVASQYPVGGVKAKIGSPVRVILSKGSPLVSVPDVRGDTEVSASIKIRAADFNVGAISRIYDSRVRKDIVIAQDPPPQAGAPRNHEVNLLVSLGPPPP